MRLALSSCKEGINLDVELQNEASRRLGTHFHGKQKPKEKEGKKPSSYELKLIFLLEFGKVLSIHTPMYVGKPKLNTLYPRCTFRSIKILATPAAEISPLPGHLIGLVGKTLHVYSIISKVMGSNPTQVICQ